MESKNIVTFLDNVGRTVIGEQVDSDTSGITKIKNPVVINVVPQFDAYGKPSGQMALQILPLFFREFMAQKDEPVYFNYQSDQITMIKFESGFDFRLLAQYENIFSPASNLIVPQGAGQVLPHKTNKPKSEEPIIKLFDDE